MKRKIYSKHIIALATALLLAVSSCKEEGPIGGNNSGVSSEITELRIISDPMQQYNVTSRSSDPKEDEEKRVHNINIFFFREDGQYLTGKYLTGNPGAPDDGGYYMTGEGVALLKIATDQIAQGQGDKFIVYAVANVGDLFATGSDLRPMIISKMIEENPGLTPMSALQSIVYQPAGRVSLEIPETGMPMIGRQTIVYSGSDITPADERIVQMSALMARVDVNLRIDSKNGSAQYPSFLLTGCQVKNVPNRVALISDGSQTGWENEEWTESTVTLRTPTTTYLNQESMKSVCSFYVFENIQEAEWVKDEGEDWVTDPSTLTNPTTEQLEKALYPDGISDAQKQRYKPYLANKSATAVELTGVYHTYNDQGNPNSSVYNVHYTLYLGSNHTNDFQLKRNHQYKNNITINGLLGVDGSSGEYTFDARVNVDENENDFYVSILREQNHDAHFCITPMDVYMFRQAEGKDVEMEVTLSEIGPDGEPNGIVPNWIRMERVSATDMENGTLSSDGLSETTHLVAGKNFTAGHGKRKYFTTDLFPEDMNNSPLKSTVILKEHRDRIYFYIDEYLKSSAFPLSNPRQAKVVMKYYENRAQNPEPVGTKTITLAQYPFLEVQVYGRTGNNTSNTGQKYADGDGFNGTGDGLIYMEQIEEYLEHYDPLDNYNTGQIYEGLKWDATGQNENIDNRIGTIRQMLPDGTTNNTERIDSWHNYVLGGRLTREIIIAYAQTVMTLNDIPHTAAEYCWNRNKRGTDGVVIEGTEKYFLPGIRQMEDALTRYYNSFPEFRDNYYWSSTPAEKAVWIEAVGIGRYWNDGERTDYARATKVQSSTDGTYTYVGSNRADGWSRFPNDIDPSQGGYKPRSALARIRVFRSDLVK